MAARVINSLLEDARALMQLLQGVDLRDGGAEAVRSTRLARVAAAEFSTVLSATSKRLTPPLAELEVFGGARWSPKTKDEAFSALFAAILPEFVRMADAEGTPVDEWVSQRAAAYRARRAHGKK